MERKNYVAKCKKNYKGIYADIDCDGTHLSDMDFIKDEYYRIRECVNVKTKKVYSYCIYPDNEWDGIYREDYLDLNEFNKYFDIIKEIDKKDDLNKIVEKIKA